MGEGSRAFRADNERDADGRLLPAPSILLNPMRVAEKMKYDALLEQFGNDMCIYVRMVCDTIVTTVPKAIVHAMIRKSEKNLLERLFHVIHNLSAQQMEMLLREEDSVVQRRKQARKALDDVKTALFQVQQQMERLNMTAAADRPEKLNLQTNVFAFSAMIEFLNPGHIKHYDKLFSGEYAPDAMKYWKTPPTSRMALPAAAQRQPTPSHAPGQAAPRGPPPPGGAPQRSPGPPGPPGQRAPPPVPNRPAPGAPAGAPMPDPRGTPVVGSVCLRAWFALKENQALAPWRHH
eukprot:gene13205-19040_t